MYSYAKARPAPVMFLSNYSNFVSEFDLTSILWITKLFAFKKVLGFFNGVDTVLEVQSNTVQCRTIQYRKSALKLRINNVTLVESSSDSHLCHGRKAVSCCQLRKESVCQHVGLSAILHYVRRPFCTLWGSRLQIQQIQHSNALHRWQSRRLSSLHLPEDFSPM